MNEPNESNKSERNVARPQATEDGNDEQEVEGQVNEEHRNNEQTMQENNPMPDIIESEAEPTRDDVTPIMDRSPTEREDAIVTEERTIPRTSEQRVCIEPVAVEPVATDIVPVDTDIAPVGTDIAPADREVAPAPMTSSPAIETSVVCVAEEVSVGEVVSVTEALGVPEVVDDVVGVANATDVVTDDTVNRVCSEDNAGPVGSSTPAPDNDDNATRVVEETVDNREVGIDDQPTVTNTGLEILRNDNADQQLSPIAETETDTTVTTTSTVDTTTSSATTTSTDNPVAGPSTSTNQRRSSTGRSDARNGGRGVSRRRVSSRNRQNSTTSTYRSRVLRARRRERQRLAEAAGNSSAATPSTTTAAHSVDPAPSTSATARRESRERRNRERAVRRQLERANRRQLERASRRRSRQNSGVQRRNQLERITRRPVNDSSETNISTRRVTNQQMIRVGPRASTTNRQTRRPMLSMNQPRPGYNAGASLYQALLRQATVGTRVINRDPSNAPVVRNQRPAAVFRTGVRQEVRRRSSESPSRRRNAPRSRLTARKHRNRDTPTNTNEEDSI